MKEHITNRVQCGLVEGSLMFIGIYLHGLGKTEDEIVAACYDFAPALSRFLSPWSMDIL